MSIDKIDRGARAAQLLDNDILREAFADIQADELDRFLAMADGDDAGRRSSQARLNAIRLLQQQLKTLVTTGKVFAQQLD